MILNYECDGQISLMDYLEEQEPPKYKRLPVGTLIGRVILGEVERAVIKKVVGNERYFNYWTDGGGYYSASEAETDMGKLQRIAAENREKYKTIEYYPLHERVTVSYPSRWDGGRSTYGQVGIYEDMLFWQDDCTYKFLVPYDSEKKLKKAYKEKLDAITGKDGFNDWKIKELVMMENQLPMTRLYWSHHGFYASAEYVEFNG